MQKRILDDYFIIIKLIVLLLVEGFMILLYDGSINNKGKIFVWCSVFLLSSIFYDYKKKLCNLIIYGVILLCFIFAYKDISCLLLPIYIFDVFAYLKINIIYYLLAFFVGFYIEKYFVEFILITALLVIIYFQNYFLIDTFKKYISQNIASENKLKQNIIQDEIKYKARIMKGRMESENKILDEKNRLSQALHDKLGHNINGSLYQLEACKVVMDKDPNKGMEIIQGVIDTLRTSMDEIRQILRNEKPDKRKMALIQLNLLCSECYEKYNIEVDMNIDDKSNNLPENVWEIVLDNTFEAISNALKYSKCDKIKIRITTLNKLVRCQISDNGVGCSTIVEGMGLQGMKNRIRKVNGYIDFDSNNGFAINMLIPL